ncbi:glutamate--cysteine ligase [Streptomyces sp. NPDC048718]|uniref:glutamate--cysteine ligase n=1 Tax=Streptomyces sp. NPDC048718 TaxID=3365587 RepID=UPI0037220810
MRSVGVEEELLLVDPDSGVPCAVALAVLASAAQERAEKEEAFQAELQREQLEFSTSPQTEMGELAEEIRRCRERVSAHARAWGAAAVALATSPLPVTPSLGSATRHQWLAERFGMTAQEQLTCGCHVHVSVASDEEGVAVLDRIRPWLSVLTALSANSPFWQGRDSGYSSYRSRVWGRWPSAGPTELFGSADRYHGIVRDMLATGALLDEGMVYFDARLAHSYPTVEIRVADVCLDARTTVVLAALSRALVETAARQWENGEPASRHGVPLLRLAAWQAARSGLDGPLVHPLSMRPAPAESAVRAFLHHVEDSLADHGDLSLVRSGLAALLDSGTGARVQRELLKGTGTLADVVRACLVRTAA